MYNIPSDVYTSHPQLSRALPLVSKQLSTLSLKGACNSMISNEELITYVGKFFESKLLLMFVYDDINGYSSRTNITILDSTVDILLDQDDVIHLESIVTETPKFEVIRFKRLTEHLPEYPDDFYELIENNEVYTDIITAYRIFSKRKICLQYPNYAKQMTKEYFDHVVNQLLNHAPTLASYLLSNSIIINIYPLIRRALNFFESRDYEDISEYQKRIKDKIDLMLNDINQYIDDHI